MSRKRKQKPSGQRILLSALCVLLAIILALMIVVAVFVDSLLGRIDRVEPDKEMLSDDQIEELLKPESTRGEDYSGPAYKDEDIRLPETPAQVIQNDEVINILLIGQDRRGSTGRSLSDAMILCSINKKTKTLTMTSFLRDIYVSIPGRKSQKLNAAYLIGGMELLDKTLAENFGVQVDGNVEVDFSQFSKLIDLLGGVDMNLTEAEAAHLNREYGFALTAGVNHLNGEQALHYSRIRKIGTDFGRTDRQRKVIAALVDQFRNASVAQLMNTLTGVLDLITTDMTDAEIVGYVVELAPMLKDLKIESQHIPADGTYDFGDVSDRGIVDCIFIDFEANRKLLADVLDG